ncbi:MAG: hypothetical protein U5K30_12415 [Acidimicrobiales bacterium]|nr:hypothetical protein [Acidimicrobiales bacterium]
MAAKRPNKSERQKRNRARREARAARSARAGEATELYQSRSEETEADDSGWERGTSDDEGTEAAPAKRTRAQKAAASKAATRQSRYQYPGQRAVVLALLFTIASVGLLLFTPVRVEREVPADEVPAEFEDDAEVADDEETATYLEDAMLLDEESLGVAIVIMAVPVAITGAAVYLKDHEKRSTVWTFAMLAMAGYVFFLGGAYAIYTLPALIALGVGGFQARRDENKERMAELRAERDARKAAKAEGKERDGEVIDVEPVDEDETSARPDDEAADDLDVDETREDDDREV